MFLEVFIYLVIVFGILAITITAFEKDVYIDEKYLVMKKDDACVKAKIEITGLEDKDVKDITWILKRGKYEDIYDIVDEFEIVNTDSKE